MRLTTLRTAAAIVLALASSFCHGPKSGNLVRLIEGLDAHDVVRTPLADMPRIFAPVTQVLQAADFKKVSLDNHDYWAAVTTRPFLGSAEEGKLEQASLTQSGTELRYSDEPLASFSTWRWLRPQRSFNAEGGKPSHDFKGWTRLDRGQSLRVTGFFGAGRALFEVQAMSGEPESYLTRLALTVSGQRQEVTVGARTTVRFAGTMSLGPNEIRVAFLGALRPDGRPPSEPAPYVLLRPVQVRQAQDLVLVSLSAGRAAPSGSYSLSYIPEPEDVFLEVNKEASAGDSVKASLDFKAPGRASLDVAGLARGAHGRLVVRVDEKPCGAQDIPTDGPFVRSFGVTGTVGPHAVRAEFEPDAAGDAADQGQGKVEIGSFGWRNPRRAFDVPLWRLNSTGLDEAGITANPWDIKKKLRIRGTSWDILMAPAVTVLRIKVRVPASGVLRFGYGLLKDADESEGDGAQFEVSITSGRHTTVVFHALVDPFHRPADRDVFFQDVDLGAYAGQRVDLGLVTRGAHGRGDMAGPDDDARNDLGFWVNPIVLSRAAAPEPKRRNVVLISMDAVRVDHLGCYGYGRDTTPNLDKLSKEGVLFENTITQAPYTLASHMTMLTGLFPTTHHVLHMSDALGPTFQTLAGRLRDQGWFTAAFTGGGLMDAHYGYARGFDEYYDRIIAQEAPDVAGPLMHRVTPWLERNKDLPFFIFLHTYQAHNPYRAPAPTGTMFLDKGAAWSRISLERFIGAGYIHKYMSLSEPERQNVMALYDGGIRYLDENLIAPLVEDLKRLGLYDNTLFIVCSDHGEEFFDHVSWGHSNTLYNELLRVPLIMKFPEEKFRGRRVAPDARLVDVVPTVLDELGVKASRRSLDGESLIPVIQGKDTRDRFCLSVLPDNIFADPMPGKISLIQGRYKIILNDRYTPRAYVYYSPPPPQEDPVMLFDLKRDPLERHNLASQKGEITRRMLAELQPYIRAVKNQRPGEKAVVDKELEERLRALGYVK